MQLKNQLSTGWDKVDVRVLFNLEETIDRCLHENGLTEAQLNRLATLYRATQASWFGVFGQRKPYHDIEVRLGVNLGFTHYKDEEFERLQQRADSFVGDLRASMRILARKALRAFTRR